MAATTHTTGRLGEVARDLRASAAGLEAFATALHQRASGMAWRGTAADAFRADVAEHAQLTSRATALLAQLASRMTAVEEQGQALRARLMTIDHRLHNQILTEIHRLEAFAAAHPGTPLPQAAVTWLEGAIQASGTLEADAQALGKL